MSTFCLSIDYLPREIRNDMTGLEMRVYLELSRLFNIRKEVIALEYANITPSLNYIAGAVNSTKTVVSRIVSSLKNRGLIAIRHQRKRNGEYAVNTYMVGEVFRTLLKRFMDKVKGNKDHHLTVGSTSVSFIPQEDNYLKDFLIEMRGKFKGRSTPGLSRAL